MAPRKSSPSVTRTNVSEVTKFVASLTLDAQGAATAQIALTLAGCLDAAEPREAAALARQLAEVLERLSPADEDDDDDWTAPTPT